MFKLDAIDSLITKGRPVNLSPRRRPLRPGCGPRARHMAKASRRSRRSIESFVPILRCRVDVTLHQLIERF